VGALLALGLPALASTGASPGVPAFVVDGGTQVRLSGATHLTLDCDLRNHGAFTPAPGSVVVLNGYGSPLLLGAGSFADLVVALHGTAAIGNAASVTGTLALASGWLSLAGHDLAVNAIWGGSEASYVVTPDTLGRLVRTVGSAAATEFPVGNTSYNPMSIRTGTGTDEFRVAVLDAPPATGLEPASALTRAWAVGHTNGPEVNGWLTYSVQWNKYECGDEFDRSFGEATSAWAWRWLNDAWVPQADVRRTDNGGFPAVDSLVTLHAGLWTLGGIRQLLAADPPGAGAPRALELAAAFPNPSPGATSLRYGLPQRTRVTLALYSVLGERVATLADGEQDAGWHVVRYDAAKLQAGIYFLRLQAGAETRSSKLVRMR
jgi:hypothetical protein